MKQQNTAKHNQRVATALAALNSPNKGFNPNPYVGKREPTYFKQKNYQGYPSREAWSEAFKTRKLARYRKDPMKEEKRKIKKEAKEIQELAREYTQEALNIMATVMRNEDEVGATRLMAAEKLLERGHGKPVTPTMNLNVNADAKPEQLNVADLDTEVARTLREVRKLTGGETKTDTSEDRPPDLRLRH